MPNHINSIIDIYPIAMSTVGADLCVCPFLYQIMGE